jgi:hypothetical protein
VAVKPLKPKPRQDSKTAKRQSRKPEYTEIRKVTLYLPGRLDRKLEIAAAERGVTKSGVAQMALEAWL